MNAPDPAPVEVTLAEVIAFVRAECVSDGPLNETTALQDLGVYGDDMDDFMRKFADRFDVDLSGYRWYFHTGEEGFNPIWFFIRPPNRLVEEIPITLAVLLESARRKLWAIEYPPHTLPRVRWDVVLTWVMVGLLAAASVVCCGLRIRG
jgi:hypothetical protein